LHEPKPVDVLEKGVKLELMQDGREMPAWMLNGPEYKVIDMDAVEQPKRPDQAPKPGKPPPPVHQVVAELESIAATVGRNSGRSTKDVTLDPKTKRCCGGLAAALSERPAIDRTLLSLLVRASIALAKVRILHQGVLDCLARAEPERLRGLDSSRIVEGLWSFATMNILCHSAAEQWAAALDLGSLRQLSTMQLSNLCWAAATLGLERTNPELPTAIAGFIAGLDLPTIPFGQLGRMAWGLARMLPSLLQLPSWAVRLAAALEAVRPKPGLALGEGLWALAHWGEVGAARSVFARCGDEALGREAYSTLLRMARGDSCHEIQILRHMVKHIGSQGLKAAVFNSVLLRLQRRGSRAVADEVLREMAAQSLWTPVTYEVHRRLGSGLEATSGQPPIPGCTDPGQSAHKYTKAVYHALGHAPLGDSAEVLARLESFSRERGWLKFGAEGEKGGVVDGALRGLRAGAAVVELGTFIGYSSTRLARQLGSGCRILTVEVDPEVACLAENLLLHAGVEDRVEVLVGSTEDVVPELRAALGARPADLVYMDHNQMIYHQDVRRLEAAGVIGAGTVVVATQVLKPGAPLLAWHLAEQRRLGRCSLELVSSPDCGQPMMEDWVAVARYSADPRGWEAPEPAPEALQQLARLCNLMRWRTAQGLVDDKKWNCFVQHVRAGMEAAGLTCTRHVWEARRLQEARGFRYVPLDY